MRHFSTFAWFDGEKRPPLRGDLRLMAAVGGPGLKGGKRE